MWKNKSYELIECISCRLYVYNVKTKACKLISKIRIFKTKYLSKQINVFNKYILNIDGFNFMRYKRNKFEKINKNVQTQKINPFKT